MDVYRKNEGTGSAVVVQMLAGRLEQKGNRWKWEDLEVVVSLYISAERPAIPDYTRKIVLHRGCIFGP